VFPAHGSTAPELTVHPNSLATRGDAWLYIRQITYRGHRSTSSSTPQRARLCNQGICLANDNTAPEKRNSAPLARPARCLRQGTRWCPCTTSLTRPGAGSPGSRPSHPPGQRPRRAELSAPRGPRRATTQCFVDASTHVYARRVHSMVTCTFGNNTLSYCGQNWGKAPSKGTSKHLRVCARTPRQGRHPHLISSHLAEQGGAVRCAVRLEDDSARGPEPGTDHEVSITLQLSTLGEDDGTVRSGRKGWGAWRGRGWPHSTVLKNAHIDLSQWSSGTLPEGIHYDRSWYVSAE
jgi:hypothetical protein